MRYTIDRLITGAPFDAVGSRTRAALAANGFGVLTEIDVAVTMKKKISVDMPPYRILGARNPQMAWQAIGMEPRVWSRRWRRTRSSPRRTTSASARSCCRSIDRTRPFGLRTRRQVTSRLAGSHATVIR